MAVKPGTTIKDFVDMVRALAAESPTNQYIPPGCTKPGEAKASGKGCSNNKGTCTNGSVGCIIGQAASRLGYEFKDNEIDDRDACDLVRDVTEKELDPFVFTPTMEWLTHVQREQDYGKSWGESVESADRYFMGV